MFEAYPDVLTVKQVQDMLQLGRDNTYNLIRCGAIPSVRINRQIRIKKEDVLRFLNGDRRAS